MEQIRTEITTCSELKLPQPYKSYWQSIRDFKYRRTRLNVLDNGCYSENQIYELLHLSSACDGLDSSLALESILRLESFSSSYSSSLELCLIRLEYKRIYKYILFSSLFESSSSLFNHIHASATQPNQAKLELCLSFDRYDLKLPLIVLSSS